MLTYPNIDPIAISLGPVKVHWYGLMYVIGIGLAWWLTRRRTQRPGFPWTAEQVEDMIFYNALGLVLGGRLGYVLFYNFAKFLEDPMSLLRIWEGGMAFHGGLIGGLIGLYLGGRRHGISMIRFSDFVGPYVPLGLLAGRIGNFINAELWGKATDLPWGMVFPNAGPEPRHPSMLYEALLEGVFLFIVLQLYRRTAPPTMGISGLFMLLYGLCRFAVEFVRVPDEQLGYLAFDWLTMGQVLCIPMLLLGILMLVLAYRRGEVPPEARA